MTNTLEIVHVTGTNSITWIGIVHDHTVHNFVVCEDTFTERYGEVNSYEGNCVKHIPEKRVKHHGLGIQYCGPNDAQFQFAL